MFIKHVSPFQLSFCYGMIISLNTCLCFDLILTQRDPFTRPESRYVKYFTISVLLSLFSACIRLTIFKGFLSLLSSWIGFPIFGDGNVLSILMVITYSTVAIYSLFVTIKSLRSKDMSSTARQMIFRRHIAYIVVNFLCQFYSFFSKITSIYRKIKGMAEETEDSDWMKGFAVLYFG